MVVSVCITFTQAHHCASRYGQVDPLTAEEMEDHAKFFEHLAVQVQNTAEDDEPDLALASLDCELPLWRGMALIDLAVESKSLRFLEECCPEVIKIRLYGDLKATSLDSWIGTLKIILGILSLGLLPAFLPSYMEWTKPPVRSSLVPPTVLQHFSSPLAVKHTMRSYRCCWKCRCTQHSRGLSLSSS